MPAMPTECKASRPPRRRRRWPWVVVGAAVLVLLLLLLLPTLLSLAPARKFLLRKISAKLDGSVHADSWSLGWSSGLLVEGFRLDDAEGQPVVRCQRIRTATGLLRLLRSRRDLGSVEVDSPRADLVLHEDGTSNLSRIFASQSPGRTATRATRPTSPRSAPTGLDLTARLLVRDGTVVVHAPGQEPFELNKLNADARMDGPGKPLTYTVEAAVGPGGTPLKAQGSVDLSKVAELGPEAIQADVEATLAGLDLAALAAQAKALGLPVDLAGRADVAVTAHVSSAHDVQAAGTIAAQSLSVTGGPLGADRLECDTAGLDFDVALQGKALRVTRLALSSPLADASASGTLSLDRGAARAGGTLTATVRVDVARLARQIPHALGLRQGLAVDQGVATFDATLSSDGVTTRVQADGRLADLAATSQGKPIALEAPVLVHLDATAGPQGPVIEAMQVAATFATVHASGTPADFALDGSADLAAATRELSKFLDLGGAQLAGKATASVRLTRDERADSADRRLAARVELTGFAFTRPGAQPLVEQSAAIEVTALAAIGEDGYPREFQDVRASLRTTPLQAQCSAERLTLGANSSKPSASGVALSGKADLGALAGLARSLHVAPDDFHASGLADVAIRADLADGMLRTAGLDVTVPDLALALGQRRLAGTLRLNVKAEGAPEAQKLDLSASLDSLHLTIGDALPFDDPHAEGKAAGTVSPAGQRVQFDSFQLGSGLANIQAQGVLSDWAASRRLEASGTLDVDLDRLAPLLAAATGRPVALSGRQSGPFHLDTRLGSGDWRQVLAQTSATAGSSVEQATIMGVDLAGLHVGVKIDRGSAVLTVSGKANGGALALAASVAPSTAPPVLTVPDDSHVLAGATLTDAMANQVLARLSPIFHDALDASGTLDLDCNRLTVPLDGTIASKSAMVATLGLKQVSFKPTGALANVLSLVKLADKEVALPDQQVRFELRDGRLYEEGLRIGVGAYSALLSGSVGLDQTLDLLFELPVTAELVGEQKVFELLQGETLKVRVGGTTAHPEIARDVVGKNVQDLVRRAAKKQLQKEAQKALEKALHKRQKDTDKEKPAEPTP